MAKILVVGAGLSGAVAARIMADKGHKVDLIDKRSHIAGNCYDYLSEYNIWIHRYGPHIFHTSNEEVIKFVKEYSEWTAYKHKVKALLEDGNYVTFPVNKSTLKYVSKEKLIDVFYRPYSEKMWGRKLEDIDGNVLNRVKIRDDESEEYFPNDIFQALPIGGYTNFVRNIIDHHNIKLYIGKTFSYDKVIKQYGLVISTSSIDEIFDYCFGALPYRSLIFHRSVIALPRVLPVPTVNYTNNTKYTRVTEWKSYPNQVDNVSNEYTEITYEEPCEFNLKNNTERFYPIASAENSEKYTRYLSLIDKNKYIPLGRCGLYRYIDMDDAIYLSMQTCLEL